MKGPMSWFSDKVAYRASMYWAICSGFHPVCSTGQPRRAYSFLHVFSISSLTRLTIDKLTRLFLICLLVCFFGEFLWGKAGLQQKVSRASRQAELLTWLVPRREAEAETDE